MCAKPESSRVHNPDRSASAFPSPPPSTSMEGYRYLEQPSPPISALSCSENRGLLAGKDIDGRSGPRVVEDAGFEARVLCQNIGGVWRPLERSIVPSSEKLPC